MFSSSPKKQMHQVMVGTWRARQECRQARMQRTLFGSSSANQLHPARGLLVEASVLQGRATTFYSHEVLLSMEAQLKARGCWGAGEPSRSGRWWVKTESPLAAQAAVTPLLRNAQSKGLTGVAAALGPELPHPATFLWYSLTVFTHSLWDSVSSFCSLCTFFICPTSLFSKILIEEINKQMNKPPNA